MKPKYHFFKATQTPCGKSLLSLPGQRLGSFTILPGILVKDMRGSTAVASARRKAVPGEVFFTTTLRRNGHSLVARDMASLDKNGDVLLSDARDAYDRLTSSSTNPSA